MQPVRFAIRARGARRILIAQPAIHRRQAALIHDRARGAGDGQRLLRLDGDQANEANKGRAKTAGRNTHINNGRPEPATRLLIN